MSERSLGERRVIHYSGHVQGVGFRYTTQRVAARFDISGWVKNLPDGRVKVVVEGQAGELDHFQQALGEAMEGQIDQVDVSSSPALGEFEGFQIRH